MTIRSTPIRPLVALAVAVALAACSGSSISSLPGAAAQSGNAPAHRSRPKVKATIRITVPKRKHHRRVRIHGHYVSPATQSIAIQIIADVGGAVTNANANLNAQNQNCTASLVSPLICTVSLTLEPGGYVASFSTWDGVLSGAGTPTNSPLGNELSANQNVPITIVAGQSNSLNVVLDGVPSAVALVPAANSTLIGNQNLGYTASKCGSPTATSERVSVFGVDADGNYILGPGAPTPSLVSSNTAVVAVSTPGPLAPNTFTLTHPISSTSQPTVQLTSTATPLAGSGVSGAEISTNLTIAGGTNICGVMTEYTLPHTRSFPTGITAGPDGNVWFAEYGGSRIGKITTGGSISEFSTPTTLIEPYGIVARTDNHLWFTSYGTGNIGDVTTGGTVSVHTTAIGASALLFGITVAASGNLWLTERSSAKVDEYSTVLTQFGPPPKGNSPQGIVAGPDGNLWFAEANGYIGQITTGGSITEFSVGITGTPQFITVGADQNLWFSDGDSGDIGRITTGGTITEFPTPSGGESAGITLGPDGNVWFSEYAANKIGAITTTGTVTEYSVPTASASLAGIAAGPDGALWFSECTGNKIGRLQ